MSFEPFKFIFTPPPTVQVPTTSSGVLPSTISQSSNASKIISKLNDLIVTSKYLQDTIVGRNRSTGIEIDSAVDPNTARALSSVYGTDTPPKFITVPMYDQLLDAHLGALQLEMAVGKDSSVQANPMQVADLMTVFKASKDHLINSATYNTWLSLQLNALKGDTILFQSWLESLKTYPAYYSSQEVTANQFQPNLIHASDVDINSDLFDYENTTIDHFGQSYANIYQSMSGVHPVERDLNPVLLQYLSQPLPNILRIISLFISLKGMIHKPSMENLVNDVNSYTFIRLASEMVGSLHTTDQLVSISVSPLKKSLGSLGGLLAGVQSQSSQIGRRTGNLSGLSKGNSCSQSNPFSKAQSTSPLVLSGTDQVPEGVKYLGEHLDWGIRQTEGRYSLLNLGFRQITQRRLKHQDDMNELMCSTRALDALTGAANGVAQEFQKNNISSSPTPQQQQEAINRILNSLQTGSNTTFISQDSQVIVNAQDMPDPPQEVVNVLKAAKIHTTLGGIEL